MLSKLDELFKKWDKYIENCAKESLGNTLVKIYDPVIESLQKEIKLLESLETRGVNIDTAISIRKMKLKSINGRIESCNIVI